MTHIPVEGGSTASHPLISRFMKGNFELKPPTPKYLHTWDVSITLLSYKVLMLCALTSFNRADTLQKLLISLLY